MNGLWKLIGKLFGWEKANREYWDRFIEPQIVRARALGLGDDTIGQLLQRALDESDMLVIFPGCRLRDLINQEAPADD